MPALACATTGPTANMAMMFYRLSHSASPVEAGSGGPQHADREKYFYRE
jgi:hypothetical protein